MRIQYFSDLHLEHLKEYPKIQAKAQILCLLGDIGHPFSELYKDFLIDISCKFVKIFMITGNHEYYSKNPNFKEKTMNENNEKIKLIIKENNLTNVSFLNDSCEYYDDYLFVGTTLWSHIKDKKNISNDTNYIKDLNVDDINELHHKCVDFLKETFKSNNDKQIIVLSHFLPSFQLIDDEYLSFGKILQCFASHNEELINKPVKLWLYGHTHKPKKSIINFIPITCNPIGYSGENSNPNFEEIIILI